MLALQCSLKVLVIILTIHMHAGILLPTISDKCLACICHVESRCNRNIGCRWDVGSDSCGPLQIKEVFWKDCHRPGGGYKQCANDYNCAKRCTQAFMKRYGGKTCGTTCEDYARMHNGGPSGCKKSSTNWYWNKIKEAGCNRHS
ncbi:lysozyme-like [Mytilus californianus]|uniref:lysozyme-like n=1 Tax=Mytilus californianus TaxID=6549 RepID=UPI00224851DF|nr:lysozyme-like [Mytilus californianus]